MHAMITTVTRLITLLNGKLVGADGNGNKYYLAKRNAGANSKFRRWAVYARGCGPTHVPAEWHRWLHYTTDTIPTDKGGDGEPVPPPRGHAHKPVETYSAWRP